MPLVCFTPLKARLVVEQGKASVLVMRVVVTQGDGVELANGDALERLVGVLRIREHPGFQGRAEGRASGTLVYVNGGSGGTSSEPAKFQINISMAQDKFDTLFKLALAGRLPARFFVDAGVRTVGRGTRGLTHVTRRGRRIKQWDTTAFRILPVTNFVAILPVAVAMAEPVAPGQGPEFPLPGLDAAESPATNAQLAELADELLVYHGETRATQNAIIAALVVIVLIVLATNLFRIFG
jgi:hypothetical protein